MLGRAPRSVAVLRALMLGDLLCATPALRALRRGLPGARITLVGLPWAQALAERLDSVDDFVAMPGWPGLPENPPADDAARAAFVQSMRARGFDLALQMHGSGEVVNDLIAAWQPAAMAGFGKPPAAAAGVPRCFLPWPAAGSEVERMLALTDRIGLPRQGTALDFPLRAGDFAAARALRGGQAPGARRPYAVVHPGSQWPSRRWPADRFAAVADALAAGGLDVVVTGGAAELPLAQDVAAAMSAPARVLAGQTTLWTLGALVADARLVVCNDTGVSHVAAALRTPSVVVASGSDVARWAPLDGGRHRVLWQDRDCRPCSHPVCPEQQACARAVGADAVGRVALQMAALAGAVDG